MCVRLLEKAQKADQDETEHSVCMLFTPIKVTKRSWQPYLDNLLAGMSHSQAEQVTRMSLDTLFNQTQVLSNFYSKFNKAHKNALK